MIYLSILPFQSLQHLDFLNLHKTKTNICMHFPKSSVYHFITYHIQFLIFTTLAANASFSKTTVSCSGLVFKKIKIRPTNLCHWTYHFDEFFFQIRMKFVDGCLTNSRVYFLSVAEWKKKSNSGTLWRIWKGVFHLFSIPRDTQFGMCHSEYLRGHGQLAAPSQV